MKFTKYSKRIFVTFSCCLFIISINYEIVSVSTRDMILKEITDIHPRDICLIMGTPKHLQGRNINDYYQNRIQSAVELYENHKVFKILISADTLNKYLENEVELMKIDLMKSGIPETDLIFDRRGESTWKSLLNSEKLNKDKFIIVSQKFHLERALYLAHGIKLDALGFVSPGKPTFRLFIREVFARIKMQKDLLFN
jgi:SanA protein